MKAGDCVKLVGIPAGLGDDAEMQTRALFEKCLGRTFIIQAMKTFEGVPYPLAELLVGEALGEACYTHTIWVEEEYLRAENSN
jgi:hypothetical protein